MARGSTADRFRAAGRPWYSQTVLSPGTYKRDMVESNHDGSATDGVDVAALRRYLATTDVRFAVLFGSRVRGETHDSSDVDVVLRFPEELSPKERFRRRNRIDTDLQGYADDFVDVSDIEDLPLPIGRAALREGVRLVGDERELTAYREQIDAEYERTAADREWDRREFIDRLARGDI